MKRGGWLIALGMAVLVAALLGPLASSAPDGLEWAAERLGFIERTDEPLLRSPLPDYTTPGVDRDAASTAVSGVIGTLVVAAVLVGLGLVVRRRSVRSQPGARTPEGRIGSASHRFDDRIRILLTVFAVVITVTVPPWWSHGVLFALLLVAALAGGVSLGTWLRRWAAVTPFLLVIGLLVPFSQPGEPVVIVWERAGWVATDAGIEKWALVTVRGLLAIGWLTLLAVTTTPERIVSALAHLGVPGRLLTIGWLTYRYLWVFADEARSLYRAWSVRRAMPRRRDDVRALSWVVGVLFLRALERAERVHRAMQARGFTGEAPAVPMAPLQLLDLVFAVVAVCAGVALVVTAHGMLP